MALLFIVILPYRHEEESDKEICQDEQSLSVLAQTNASTSNTDIKRENSLAAKRSKEISVDEIEVNEIPRLRLNDNRRKDSQKRKRDGDDGKPEKATKNSIKDMHYRTDASSENEYTTNEKKCDLTELSSQEPEIDPTHFGSQSPIHKRVDQVLDELDVVRVHINTLCNGTFIQYSFIEEDIQHCEEILNKLKSVGVGNTGGSSLSVFPSSYHESCQKDSNVNISDKCYDSLSECSDDSKKREVLKKESQFKKSIKSRLVVAQVVSSVKSNALFTFDYLLLLILASIIACLGLVENSSVALVASMLISPLMGPILATTFGQIVRMHELRNMGIKSEIIGLALCLTIGFAFGLITGGVGLHGAIWGATDAWPTAEMKSRGMLRGLWVGVLIALPSGAGVAISVLGGNAGSLVGVAISASLLPPACNAGMLWAYALLAAIVPPKLQTESTTIESIFNATSTASPIAGAVRANTYATITDLDCHPLMNNNYIPQYSCNLSHDAALLGCVSLTLTVVNIICILLMGVVVLKIKEVAPYTAGVEKFWKEDVDVARSYYLTAKGEMSESIGQQFLKEWKEIQEEKRLTFAGQSTYDTDLSLDESGQAIDVRQFLKDAEESPETKAIISRLSYSAPLTAISADLDSEYNKALMHLNGDIRTLSGSYRSQAASTDNNVRTVYDTFHTTPEWHANRRIWELRTGYSKRPNTHIGHLNLDKKMQPIPESNQSRNSMPKQQFFKEERNSSKFHVTRVDDDQACI